MKDQLTTEQHISLAKTYFEKVDSGAPDLLDMFSDDAHVYFPTFGMARGKREILRFVVGLTAAVATFEHDPATMVFTGSGDRLAVEGVEAGASADGRTFPGKQRAEDDIATSSTFVARSSVACTSMSTRISQAAQ